jgi:hypothetical protein
VANAIPDPLVDPLYETPPAAFVAARKRIVAALKQAGRVDDAKAVDRLPRPPLQVWTANQVARRDGGLVKRLVALTDRLKSVGGADYASAATELRRLSSEIRDATEKVLAAAGHEVDPQILQRVLSTLRAAAGHEDQRALMVAGRLVRDVGEPEAASLFGHGAAPAGPAASHPAAKPSAATPAAPKSAPSAEERQRERERARDRVALEKRIERLKDAAADARKELDKAERADAEARMAATAAADRLTRTRQQSLNAARELAGAEAELRRLG